MKTLLDLPGIFMWILLYILQEIAYKPASDVTRLRFLLSIMFQILLKESVTVWILLIFYFRVCIWISCLVQGGTIKLSS